MCHPFFLFYRRGKSSNNSIIILNYWFQYTRRLLPAVSGLNRLTQTPLVLSGYQIPRGSRVGVPGIVNQHAERHYPRAREFAPERWLRGCPAHHTAHPFTHIPFSHGPRMCIGRRFAELEVRGITLCARLLTIYYITYVTGPVINMNFFDIKLLKPPTTTEKKFSDFCETFTDYSFWPQKFKTVFFCIFFGYRIIAFFQYCSVRLFYEQFLP